MKKKSPFSGKTLLLAGGDGFIGRHTARAAVAAGFAEIISLTRTVKVEPDISGISGFPGISDCDRGTEVSRVSLDLLDVSALAAFARSRTFDFIINLAGKIDHASGPGVYPRQFEINFQTALNLVEAFQGRVGRFIQVGSGMEYGVAPAPQSPDGPAAPASAYGVSKLAASQLVLAKARSENFPALVARPFSVYGLGQPQKSFLDAALTAARKGQGFPTTLGEQTRDFVPVEKVAAELIELCALQDGTYRESETPTSSLVGAPQVLSGVALHGRIFNLCTGIELSLRRVLEIVQEQFPAFTPDFDAIPYRDTELMRSSGHPFRPWTKEETESALRRFLFAR
jgi:nucleoside-diphosphate-sugar epimerase